jgi:hypothetical protein
MEIEERYECGSCHRTAVVADKEIPPQCCGKPMNKLPHEICLQPSHAESARSMEKDDACDDGRTGV